MLRHEARGVEQDCKRELLPLRSMWPRVGCQEERSDGDPSHHRARARVPKRLLTLCRLLVALSEMPRAVDPDARESVRAPCRRSTRCSRPRRSRVGPQIGNHEREACQHQPFVSGWTHDGSLLAPLSRHQNSTSVSGRRDPLSSRTITPCCGHRNVWSFGGRTCVSTVPHSRQWLGLPRSTGFRVGGSGGRDGIFVMVWCSRHL